MGTITMLPDSASAESQAMQLSKAIVNLTEKPVLSEAQAREIIWVVDMLAREINDVLEREAKPQKRGGF